MCWSEYGRHCLELVIATQQPGPLTVSGVVRTTLLSVVGEKYVHVSNRTSKAIHCVSIAHEGEMLTWRLMTMGLRVFMVCSVILCTQ